MNKNEFEEPLILLSIGSDNKKNEKKIIYNIQFQSELTGKNWEIEKDLEDLSNMNKYLLSNFSNLPLFPDINFAYLNLQKTKVLIEKYLTEILNRDDIISNPEVEKFFNLKEHFQDFYKYQPTIITFSEILSSFLCKIEKFDGIYVIVYLNELSLINFNENEFKFEELTKKKTSVNISFIKYSNIGEINFVLCGLNNGIIEIFNIYFNTQKQKFYMEKMNQVKPHSNKVLGIGFDPSNGYIYSSSINDNIIIISEINYESIINRINLKEINIITGLYYDNNKKILFIINSYTSIFCYEIENLNKFNLKQALHEGDSYGKITIFKYDSINSYLLIGTSKSDVLVYYFDMKQNTINIIEKIKCDKNSRFEVKSLSFNHKKSECIVSLSNGKIQFWSLYKNYPVFILDCCQEHKYEIYFNESKNILICNCDDNNIKKWKIPLKWTGEEIKYEKYKKIPDSIFLNKKDNLKEINIDQNEQIKENNFKNDEDYYDSSLDGWEDEKTDEIERKYNLNKLLSL